MFTVAKRQLKAGMSAYFRRVEQTGEEMVVTDRHRPVLRVSPIRQSCSVEEAFADIRGNVLHPADAAELCTPTLGEWDEARDDCP